MKQLLALSLLILGTTAISAQMPKPPAPGAEQKNLERFAGTWKMEGTAQASPLGPGGQVSGTETCRMFGDWHLVCESTGTGPWGPMKGHAIMTWDRAEKRYRYFAVNDVMPDAELATGTKTGDTWTWTSSMDVDGKTIHSRFVMVDTSPTSYTFKWEMSEDGKTYRPMMEGKSTKTGP
jgi:hypothetical protein